MKFTSYRPTTFENFLKPAAGLVEKPRRVRPLRRNSNWLFYAFGELPAMLDLARQDSRKSSQNVEFRMPRFYGRLRVS